MSTASELYYTHLQYLEVHFLAVDTPITLVVGILSPLILIEFRVRRWHSVYGINTNSRHSHVYNVRQIRNKLLWRKGVQMNDCAQKKKIASTSICLSIITSSAAVLNTLEGAIVV
jgi:hypothetical protein